MILSRPPGTYWSDAGYHATTKTVASTRRRPTAPIWQARCWTITGSMRDDRRAADLAGLAADYATFVENAMALKDEIEMLHGEKMDKED